MSEYLQNGKQKREILKGLIRDLHKGTDPGEIKRRFSELVTGVEATEIAEMEQQLISEGMPSEEIKKLCDVHAAVFREHLMKNEQPEFLPGHPLHTLKHENEEAGKSLDRINGFIQNLLEGEDGGQFEGAARSLREELSSFRQNIDKHYSKKENILFPYLERHDITGPPSVMWSVDDEIRDMIKKLAVLIKELKPESNRDDLHRVKDEFNRLKDKVSEMFFKEENILSPMMKDALTEEEWAEIKEQESDFGVVFSRPEEEVWQPQRGLNGKVYRTGNDGALPLDTGGLAPKEINMILTNLPIDITFVDKNDVVRYFSQGKDRIFTRTKSIIGRKVQNCHPPESVHMVEKIVNDFKSGKQSLAEFWLELNGSFIYIRYVALRDENGEYLGTMEVTQDLTKLRALQGERRLLQYSE